MSYEDAPATRMLATHCVACGRPLCDSVSVEAGMGPDCRARNGYDDDAPDEARREMNVRVFALALFRSKGGDPRAAVDHLATVRARGFARLADKLEEALVEVEVVAVDAKTMALKTPYDEAFLYDLRRRTHAYRWDRDGKRWLLPLNDDERKLVWQVLTDHFPGKLGRGPKGLFAVTT